MNLPLALAYATYLHCENKGDDACGVCRACTKSLKYIHPDTHFVFPVSKVSTDKNDERFRADIFKEFRAFLLSQPFGSLDDWTAYYGGEDKLATISRDEGREIIKSLSLKPFESAVKVMIIWQPETMHSSAANGILKILEEPAAHTYFILVTNAADRLPPTILSRTQIITIPLLQDEEVESHLKSLSVDSTKAEHITQLADGNLNLALSLIDNEDEDYSNRFAEWMRTCFRKNYGRLVALADEYHSLDKLQQRNIMLHGMNMMRASLLQHTGAQSIHRIHGEELKFIQDFSKVMNVKKIDKAYRIMNDATYHLERNGSAKMIFMDTSLQLANVINP